MKRFKIKKTVPVIDMVYTWVDGNDEKIIKEKQELLKEKNFTIESTHKARFFNNDESGDTKALRSATVNPE